VIGRTISHYRILEKLGEGGMGVVYKAEDTQLRRTVALKFLSSETVGNEDVKARLIREAQASASLDHPNICQVFGIHEQQGQTFIAMAYIDGPALADKIEERPLPLGEAVDFAIQLAEGLQEAHEKRIVHRDIKPHNVMLTAKGQIKIMDFGLASLAGRSKLTKSGTTLGTPAYMAPEQLEGSDVDRRADIWALGCVLYEMLTQRTPFDAEYEQAIAYGILNEEPEPVSAQRADVQPEVDRIIGKALAKDREQRYQHADDLLVDLRRLLVDPTPKASRTAQPTPETPTPAAPVVEYRPRKWLWPSIAACLALAAATGWFQAAQLEDPEKPVRRFALELGINILGMDDGASDGDLVISPDGKALAFTRRFPSGLGPLFLRHMSSEEPRRLADRARQPFWSPDSRFVGFRSSNELKWVSRDGGQDQTICTIKGEYFGGAAWSPDGENILFTEGFPQLLYRVPAVGGEPEVVLDLRERSLGISTPQFLPNDPGRVLVSITDRREYDRPGQAAILDLSSLETRLLGLEDVEAFSPPGHLILGRRTTRERPSTWAVTLDVDDLTVGEPFQIAENSRRASVSMDGTLVYASATGVNQLRRLRWRDRAGNVIGEIGEPQRRIADLDLSPDEKRVAAWSTSAGGEQDIWIHETDRPVAERLTIHSATERGPAWSPDGTRIYYHSTRRGLGLDIWEHQIGQAADPKLIVGSDESEFMADVSRNGRLLIYHKLTGDPELLRDLHYVELADDGASEDRVFVSRAFNQKNAQFSPDGRYVAYQADDSGRNEVYVEEFPSGARQQVSTDGGTVPVWRADGAELYYVKSSTLMAVPISLNPEFSAGKPEALFEHERFRFDTAQYDATSDGQRFVVADVVGEEAALESTVHVVENWYEEFRDRK